VKLPKREKRPVDLTLTSMIDMFTILIIYLLSQQDARYGGVNSISSVRLPQSSAREAAKDGTKIVVTKVNIMVNDAILVDLDAKGKVRPQDIDGLQIRKLAEYLQQINEKSAQQPAVAPSPGSPPGTPAAPQAPHALVIADKDVPFETIRNVLFTAGQETFADFRFAVIKKRAEAGP
jgi:biopolymer transport protein ExbD